MKILALFLFFPVAVFLFGANDCSAQVKIVKVQRSQPFPDARVRVISPRNGESVRSFSTEIRLDVENYQLGVQTKTLQKSLIANSPKGQHIHLIVDDKPYLAIYDTSKPVILNNLNVGPHTLVVFPSRSYHESVKSKGAAHVVNFNVLASFGLAPPLDLSAPALIYSRPKGSYGGDGAKRVMVDFYLRNTTLGADGYRVNLSIFEGANASPSDLVASDVFDRWQPAFVTGLQSGEYTFRLELIDAQGKRVAGQFGAEERVIKIDRSNPPAAP